jgi:hypothetical protein
MVCFMTYSVYSLNFSSLFPQQSDYLMMITLYFLLSIAWTLISMAWFSIANHYSTKGEMPKRLYAFCGLLQRIPLYCIPSPKQDKKKDGEFKIDKEQCNNVEGIESIKSNRIDPTACVSVIKTNEEAKPKCNFCNRCEPCQADFDKDKVKGRSKKDVEGRCNALNYLVLFCVFLCMFVSDMAVWISMAK